MSRSSVIESPALASLKARSRRITRAAEQAGTLVRPNACDKCGRVGDVQAHHQDYGKPLDIHWLCAQCHADAHLTTPDWVIAARELHSQGFGSTEIARLLGKSQGAVWKRLNPERAREIRREDNARRREAKQAHENQRKRRRDQRGTCNECGGPMGIGNKIDGVCRACTALKPRMSETTRALGHVVERWWNEGLTLAEIAERLGKSRGWVGGMMDAWRGAGFNLPYRYGDATRPRKYRDQLKASVEGG